MLRRGNHHPAPGPDKWEKWCVKNLSNDTLSLVVDLHNYQVMNSVFLGNIKDMWLTCFHKQGYSYKFAKLLRIDAFEFLSELANDLVKLQVGSVYSKK